MEREIPGRSPTTMSPIHTLPIELLSRVFLLGMPDHPYPEFPPLHVPAFEVLVSHVCRHWRDVALHTQPLWTTVHFRMKCHLDHRAPIYLSRSNRHLIDILVDTCAEDEYEEGYNLFRPEFKSIFDTLTPHVDRWRSLSLKVRDKICKVGARNALSSCGPARSLEYLQLWHIEDWDSPERLFTQIGPPPVVIFDKSLPALKHLSLIGVNVPWTQSPFLEDLTSIDFALHSEDVRIPYDVWAEMLSKSPGLQKLSLRYSGPRTGLDHWPDDVIALPGMQELALTDLDPPYLHDLLRRLSMPNLTKLHLELPAEEPEHDFTPLLEMLVKPPPLPPPAPAPRAAPAPAPVAAADAEAGAETPPAPRGPMFPLLRTLAVYALECSPDSFRALLAASPAVTRLELGCKRLREGLFDTLFAAPSAAPDNTASAPGVLLPALDTVHVSGADPAALVRFIEFRRAAGRPVKLWLVSERMRDAALERVAQDMVREGKGELMIWFQSDEDEDEGDEDEEDDASSYADEDEAAEALPDSEPVEDDDEHVDYSDEEQGDD